ncbi:MAG: hypothetical protein AAF333_10300 [Planctomycetota bacterium]
MEISGIRGDGATLLLVNATPEGQLTIRRKFEVSTPGTLLLGENAVLGDLVKPDQRDFTVTLPPFSLPLGDPVVLAVFEGETALQPGTALARPELVGSALTANPIADWVTLGPGSALDTAEAGLFALDEDLAAALGIDDLPQPVAATQDISVLARAIIDNIPRLDTLLPGTISGGISGASARLEDFPASPASFNPGTTLQTTTGPGDNATPEPGAAAMWLAAGGLAAGRGRRSRCSAPDRGL